MTDQAPDQPQKWVVSSSYVVSEKAVELSEVEREIKIDLGVLDILCLYFVNHRGRAKKLVDEYAALDSGSGKPIAASLSVVAR